MTNLNIELSPKRLELLHELLPHAMRMALLVKSPGGSTEIQQIGNTQAANSLKVELQIRRADTERDFDMVFASLGQPQVDGLVAAAERTHSVAGRLCWPNSPRRETSRPARAAGHQGQACHHLKTAKAFGIAFPLTLLGRADEVIE